MDPLSHPDLAALGSRLRRRMDETLDAEQQAARAAARRRRTLRDLLLEAEDRGATASVLLDGVWLSGRVVAVGADHVILEGRLRRLIVPLPAPGVIEVER